MSPLPRRERARSAAMRGRGRGTMASEALKKYATLKNLIFVLALIQIVWLVWFFYTGLGGAQELVARVMSIALILQILFMYQAGLSLQMAAADRQPPPRRALYRHLRLLLHLFLLRVRAHRDLRARLLHAAGFHRRAAGVPAGDGAVAARPSDPVLDQRRSRRLHAVGLSQPDRFLLASRHDLLSRRHVEHGRVLDRHLRHSMASSRSP